MKIRNLSLALTAVAAIYPVIGHADSADIALKACAQAFAAKLAAPGTEPVYKVTFPNKQVSSALTDYYSREFTFALQARDKSGASMAQATCSATARGSVLNLTAGGSDKLETFAAF